jgi:hypothetical protein
VPALPDVAKVLKVIVRFDDHVNLDIISRFFVSYSGSAPSASDLDTFCAALYADWITSMIGLSGATVELQGIEATDLTTVTSAQGSHFDGNAGTRTGHPVPIDAAVVTSYKISRRYRGGHPRGYWPFGVSEDLENAQKWGSAFADEVSASYTAWRDALRTHGWSGAGTLGFVNVSYYQGWTIVNRGTPPRAFNVPTLRGGGPVVDGVETFQTRLKVGTQRRRAQF